MGREAFRERLFPGWSVDSSESSEEELIKADSWNVFQGETENSLMGFPTFEVKVESPKKKRRKSSSEDSDEPNARRDIALKRKRKMGRFVESEWEFVPISKVL